MENFDQQNTTPEGLHITPEMEADMAKTGKWNMFFAVLTFIFVGLYGLFGIIGLATLSAFGASIHGDNSSVMSMISLVVVFVIIFLGLVLMQAIYQLRFANNINKAVGFADDNALSRAWMNMRNYWRMLGILIIVMIILYVVLFAVIGISGLGALDSLMPN